MTKTAGFKISATFFLPVDKKDFKAQAAAYSMVAGINESHVLPADFLSRVTLIDVSAKQGGHELPAATGSADDPANAPLTTDALAEGATIIDSMAALDDSVIQNVMLADGSKVVRRISAAQYATENPDAPLTQTQTPPATETPPADQNTGRGRRR